MKTVARAVGAQGPLAGSFWRTSRSSTCEAWEAACPAAGGIHVGLQGHLTNCGELARGLGRTDLEDDPCALVAALYRRRDAHFLAELRGPFALALYDPERHRLLLARDRLGREPLFFAEADGEVAFASRLEAISSRPRLRLDLDVEAVNLYLALQFFPLDRTAFRQIRKLPPAHVLEVSAATMRTSAYWQPPFCDEGHRLPVRSLAAELESRFLRIYRELPAAGRLGAFASGGVDSSTNLVFLARAGRPSVALTAAFDEAEYDESADAARVAASQGFEHRVVRVGEEHLELLPALAASFNEPVADQAALPTSVLLAAASGDLGGIVSGEGGDELFGPPRRFTATERLAETVTDKAALAREYASLIACCPSPLRQELLAGSGSPAEIADAPADLLRAVYERSAARNLFQLLKLGQLTTWLPENVLAKDRDASASRHLRPCFPLIDDEAVDLVTGLSATEHLAACRDKELLRETIAPHLPARALDKPKHRFLVPVARWRHPSFLASARTSLTSPESRTRDLYAPAAVDRLLAGFAQGDARCDRPLWALLVLEHWLGHVKSRRREEARQTS